nr:immunoglobulin heavy chain junction region [Macaca mulatta]MOW87771.1 immunoglobulin heavy chain junction region [Macaca mulatta]MOW88800.1 immunoglobulin heavy chain junction region [Macaca mulatta]MOW89804.1 immunoglobulin heavy chain junction region [Macaca mulatta]MOW90209.1 immunoglobulin heavy chain junction region [Macaca mulatta]
CCGRHRGDDYW